MGIKRINFNGLFFNDWRLEFVDFYAYDGQPH